MGQHCQDGLADVCLVPAMSIIGAGVTKYGFTPSSIFPNTDYDLCADISIVVVKNSDSLYYQTEVDIHAVLIPRPRMAR